MSDIRYATAGLAVVLALAVPAAPARAQTATANLTVSSNVTSQCTISTLPVAFGAYNPVTVTPLDNIGSVVVTCTTGISSTIGLGLGANASGSIRRMTDGSGNYLEYELYQEAARTTVWGNSGGGLVNAGAAPDGNPRSFTVYGRVTAEQDAPVGSYADTVVATLNF
jgi:spore coat protein U-like protein